jgi:ABC-type Fe3+-hydroxamate transport system substrate-binding protein
VSLVPSVTETLLAWGVTPIAVTRFCEQPGLRTVGGTKDPDVAAIVELAPDLVVVNDEENRAEDADALASAGVATHVVSVRRLADVTTAFAALADRLRLAVDPIDIARPGPPPPTRHAFVPIWRRPWMTLNADTYGSALLSSLGVVNAYAGAPDRYPEVAFDDVVAKRVDLVVAPSEPYPFGPRHVAELEAVAPVVLVDGRDLFWWGVRTPAAQRRLGEVFAATR